MESEHFKGKYEVELKYRLSSEKVFLEKLSLVPHEIMLENNIERDWYFDLPGNILASENKSVCIREMEPSGIKLWIVKGPERDRCEATNITKADTARSMLQNMGYMVSLKIEKKRSIYFVGEYHITVDQLDGIGSFAEFAIMTDDKTKLIKYKKELEQLASRFGLCAADLEDRSYRILCSQTMNDK